MLIVRLLRVGKKHEPYFRLVLIEKGRRPGKYLEQLGFYTPGAGEKKLQNVETERVKYWISKGAQLTPTVHNLLVDAKVIDKPKIKVKISKKKGEEKPAEAPKAEAPKAAAPAETKPAEPTEAKPAA